MPGDLEALIDELYALPLERFVPERAVLVRALRADGRREDAAAVAALPKPSVVAWAVNQVVRAQPDAARALWTAGDAVLDAQARVVSGSGSGADLRGAVEEERAALAPLAQAARGLVTGSGRFLGEAHVQPLVETLHAAAIDPGVREDVALGRLARPVTAAGIGAGRADATPGPVTPPAARREGLRRRAREDDAAEAQRRQAEREERARRQAAEQALARAERARDRARERITAAVGARDDAAAALGRAQLALARAEEDVADAHRALEQAEDAVDTARAGVEGAA